MARRRAQTWLLVFVPCMLMLGREAARAAESSSDDCLACHADTIDRQFPDGTTRALHVRPDVIAGSVHRGLACVDCHPGAREVPHEEIAVRTGRQLDLALAEQCRQCHFTEHREALESVHARALARGDLTAPSCIDCHGSHDVAKPAEPRTRVAEMCGRCHPAAAATFAKSVHGLYVARNIADVPTCTDCHGGHRLAGPQQAGWRSTTPDMCGHCHGDPKRMAKYGLSTNVLRTYLSDFHGKTASLRVAAGAPGQTVVAVCSDCHGTHDVVKVDSPSSPVLKANLATTCRKCHAAASVQFPDAWMSHYDPDWSRAPVVMGVKSFYAVLIPFMIGGMLLQVLLHLWRMAVNR